MRDEGRKEREGRVRETHRPSRHAWAATCVRSVRATPPRGRARGRSARRTGAKKGERERQSLGVRRVGLPR